MSIQVGSGMGSGKKQLQVKNRKRIHDWFKKNKGKTVTECSRALGLRRATIYAHVKAIKAGYKEATDEG